MHSKTSKAVEDHMIQADQLEMGGDWGFDEVSSMIAAASQTNTHRCLCRCFTSAVTLGCVWFVCSLENSWVEQWSHRAAFSETVSILFMFRIYIPPSSSPLFWLPPFLSPFNPPMRELGVANEQAWPGVIARSKLARYLTFLLKKRQSSS